VLVVADAAPIRYLILIDAIDILQPLYKTVLVPNTVFGELSASNAPESVQKWIAHPPSWFQIRPDPATTSSVPETLDPGERAAIALALSVTADRLLIDDWEGRLEAERQQIRITGTLGVLAEAHIAGLLNFESAIAQLSETNFYLSPELVDKLRRRLAGER
jgi:predicted nucleic acid-binding protein